MKSIHWLLLDMHIVCIEKYLKDEEYMLKTTADTHLYPRFPTTSFFGLEEDVNIVFMNCKRVWQGLHIRYVKSSYTKERWPSHLDWKVEAKTTENDVICNYQHWQ